MKEIRLKLEKTIDYRWMILDKIYQRKRAMFKNTQTDDELYLFVKMRIYKIDELLDKLKESLLGIKNKIKRYV